MNNLIASTINPIKWEGYKYSIIESGIIVKTMFKMRDTMIASLLS